MKRLLLFLAVMALSAVCAGCSKPADQSPPEQAPATEPGRSIRNKTFTNVSVNVYGAESLIRKGLIVTSDLQEQLKGISITAEVPQDQFASADASIFNLYVDEGAIQSAGSQELKILYNQPDPDYGRIIYVNPESIMVDVEEYITYTKLPIAVRIEEDMPEGWYLKSLTVEPQTVSVSGPVSLVKDLARAVVSLDLTSQKWESGISRTISEFKLRNLKGEEISSPLLTVSSEGNIINYVIIGMEIQPTREYNLQEIVQIKGEPAEGYQIVGEPEFREETITFAASESMLEELDELMPLQRGEFLLESPVLDISGLTESKEFILKTKTRNEIEVVEPRSGNVYVKVYIEETSTP